MTGAHAKAFLSVEYVKVQHGPVVERDDRMFVSSYDGDAGDPLSFGSHLDPELVQVILRAEFAPLVPASGLSQTPSSS